MNIQVFWDNDATPLQTLTTVMLLDCLHPDREGSTVLQNYLPTPMVSHSRRLEFSCKCCNEMSSLEDGISNLTELHKYQVDFGLFYILIIIKKKTITKLLEMSLYSQIDIMLHQPHSCISWPTLLIVVTNNVFIVWVWMFCEVSLNQISCLFSSKPVQSRPTYLKLMDSFIY